MRIFILCLTYLTALSAYGETAHPFFGPPSQEEIRAIRGKPHPSQEQLNDCADCHPDIVEGFKKTHMSKAFDRPLMSEVIEDFSPQKSTVIHPKTGVYYRAYIDDEGRWWQEEFNPKTSYTKQVQVKYLIGSGNHTRSYIGELHGELVELPLTWYSPTVHHNGLWDMSPGYERPDHFRFSRPVKGDCLFCHNDLSPINDEILSGFLGDLPTGITCARCHGDGTTHIERRLEGIEPPEGEHDDSILNPAHLSPSRQHQICEQCHLSGETRVLLPGQRWDQYNPRQALEDYVSIHTFKPSIDAKADPTHLENFGIASHAERMNLSSCHLGDRQLTCTTCHNPHRPDTQKSYQDACTRCHQDSNDHENHLHLKTRSQAGKNCTSPEHQNASCHSCHMVKSGTSDIPHVSMTDHWIRVPKEHDEKTLGSHLDQELAIRKSQNKNSESQSSQAHIKHDLRSLLPLPSHLKQSTKDGLLGLAYADLVRYSGHIHLAPKALSFLARAAKEHPRWIPLWGALGEISEWLGDKLAAASAYQRLRDLKPFDEYYGLKEVSALIEIKQESYAENLLKALIEHWPTRYRAWEQLANLQMKQRRFIEAERSYVKANQLAPDQHSIAHNLGLLYFVQGDLSRARAMFIEGNKRDGVSPDGPFHLALVEAAEKNYERAQELIKESLRRDPTRPFLYQQLAHILFESGDRIGALKPLREWIKRDPKSLDAYFTLAQYLDVLGRYKEVYQLFLEAKHHLSDPRIDQALELSKRRLNQLGH